MQWANDMADAMQWFSVQKKYFVCDLVTVQHDLISLVSFNKIKLFHLWTYIAHIDHLQEPAGQSQHKSQSQTTAT